jgi:uncharacterized protein YegL
MASFSSPIVFNIFQNTFMSFEPEQNKDELGYVFGTLDLVVTSFETFPQYDHKRFTFALDISGSMNDRCKDGRSKMEHMKFTLTSILRYLLKHKIPVSIALFGFDEVIEPKIKTQLLEAANLTELTQQIDSCFPRNGTNIELALKYGLGIIQTNKSSDVEPGSSSIEDVFILLTDGQPTTGWTSHQDLKRLANQITAIPNTTLVTIGCGYSHDSKLLSHLSPKNYFFVYELEQAGKIIASMMDQNLHKFLKNVDISISDGELFIWRTGKWELTGACDDIIADGNRTFHVRTQTPLTCTALISGIHTHPFVKGHHFQCLVDSKIFDQNLAKYKYRQRTLELLSEIQHREPFTAELEIKVKLTALLTEMKKYMDTNNLRDATSSEDAEFMNKLCDDVYIAYKTLGTSRGPQYISARQRSQGENGSYNQVPDERDLYQEPFPLYPPVMGRQCTQAIHHMNDDLSLPIMGRQVSSAIYHMKRDINNQYGVSSPEDFCVDEEEEGEDPVPLSRNPSCVRNTSMSLSFAQPKRKAVFFNPLVANANLEEGEEGEEEKDLDDDDTIMSQHHISGSNPYENKRCATLVREMSAAPDDRHLAAEEK